MAMLTVIVGVSLSGCGGSDGGAGAAPRLVGPAEFAQATSEPDRVTINVHVPDEGSIEGTDLAVPFDQVEARRDELPGTSTPLAVYCRSGSMSAEAVSTLARLGYEDVVELEGGMVAWQASGRALQPPDS